MNWYEAVQAAFPDETLRRRIREAATLDETCLPALFADIANTVLSTRSQAQASDGLASNGKKRKLDTESHTLVTGGASTASSSLPQAGITDLKLSFECAEVSVQVPARKKLKLQIVSDTQNPSRAELRLLHPASQQLEYSIPTSQVVAAFCLPVPERQQRQCNLVLFTSSSTGSGAPDQLVFTLSDAALPDGSDSPAGLAARALEETLRLHGQRVISPSKEIFASSIPQAHRRNELAYHVAAHRGSKDGYLFFLSTGILFGFRKPLAFFPFSAISSISYTSVLQRTFNLVISAASDPLRPTDTGEDLQETEFAMLDQADFAGIDEYVRKNGLNDASMAAARRATIYGKSSQRRGDEVGTNGVANGLNAIEDCEEQSELQKAEQALQDAEDEEEEDYEVSGGESDGEGEYSEEDGEDGDGEPYEDEEEYDEDGEEVGGENEFDGETHAS